MLFLSYYTGICHAAIEFNFPLETYIISCYIQYEKIVIMQFLSQHLYIFNFYHITSYTFMAVNKNP